MSNFEQGPSGIPPYPEQKSWFIPDVTQKPRLIFRQRNRRHIPDIEVRSTNPEAGLNARQQHLLETFTSTLDGINVQRVETFFSSQGLRIAPYRLLNEANAQLAEQMGEMNGLMGGYKPSYDLALIRRHPKLEAINGSEFTESVLVHELAHGSNEYHDLVYLQADADKESSIQHGRGGHRVYDSHGEERGRLIEEASAERQRGNYVEQVLGLPLGFAKNLLNTRFFLEGAATVAAKYTIRRDDGKPHVLTEAFAAQIFDLLCQVDPDLDHDLTLARKTAEGLRSVTKRLNRIQPGLYAYLREVPYGRESYRQCLIYIQELVGFLPKPRTHYN